MPRKTEGEVCGCDRLKLRRMLPGMATLCDRSLPCEAADNILAF